MKTIRLASLSACMFAMGSSVSVWAHNLGNALPHPHPHPAQFGLPESLFALLLLGCGAVMGAGLLARRREALRARPASLRRDG
jgi:hypothetical protein